MIIYEPEIFRERIRKSIHKYVNHMKKSTNIELSIYNYSIEKGNEYNITKKWDNPLFVTIYLDKFKCIHYHLNQSNIIEQLKKNDIISSELAFKKNEELYPELWNKIIETTKKTIENKYIITLNNFNTIKENNQFSNKEELIECCKASCFIPLVSSNKVFKYYKKSLHIDPGLYFRKYKKYIGNEKKLFIGYKMFQRFKYTLNGYGLIKHNYNIYDLYLLGYKDAQNNKYLLDYYLL